MSFAVTRSQEVVVIEGSKERLAPVLMTVAALEYGWESEELFVRWLAIERGEISGVVEK